jgi:hypothetical protein
MQGGADFQVSPEADFRPGRIYFTVKTTASLSYTTV